MCGDRDGHGQGKHRRWASAGMGIGRAGERGSVGREVWRPRWARLARDRAGEGPERGRDWDLDGAELRRRLWQRSVAQRLIAWSGGAVERWSGGAVER
ncbi:hypothetical protein L3i22_107300 [Actinoplanes sp. L3-i22]|nr:hypothetical protein L3i22_107300 [Actinoplanes sp. L3-i22]